MRMVVVALLPSLSLSLSLSSSFIDLTLMAVKVDRTDMRFGCPNSTRSDLCFSQYLLYVASLNP